MLVAVEDALSEAVVRKLIGAVRPDVSIRAVMGLQGKGYLKKRARELNRSAISIPVFLLADQDSPNECPATTIASWLGGPPQAGLLFRFAVLEVESWVLADRGAFADFLGVGEARVPLAPDALLRPKEEIVRVARGSRSAQIREDLVPLAGGTAVVGPAYNAKLTSFVRDRWDPVRAAKTSPSLARALARIQAAPLT